MEVTSQISMRRIISRFVLIILLNSFVRCSDNDNASKFEPRSKAMKMTDNSRAKGEMWPKTPIVNNEDKIKPKFYEKIHAEILKIAPNESSHKGMAKLKYIETAKITEKIDQLPLKNKTFAKAIEKNMTEVRGNDDCKYFKCNAGKCRFNFNKMAGVWQTAYYQLPEEVLCFKIQIKKVTPEELSDYKMKYGNYSNKINWNDCKLEIVPKTQLNRTHFLQLDSNDNGVFNNIIIETITDNNDPERVYDNLVEESADQWLVVNNLLLMRDCDTGGVVVFSKLPYQPVLDDIRDALKDFGEDIKSGKMPCEDEDVNNKTFHDDPEEEVISTDT